MRSERRAACKEESARTHREGSAREEQRGEIRDWKGTQTGSHKGRPAVAQQSQTQGSKLQVTQVRANIRERKRKLERNTGCSAEKWRGRHTEKREKITREQMAQGTGSQIGDSGACSTWTWHRATHPNTRVSVVTRRTDQSRHYGAERCNQTHKQHTRQCDATPPTGLTGPSKQRSSQRRGATPPRAQAHLHTDTNIKNKQAHSR